MEISRRSRREERSVAGEPPLFFFFGRIRGSDFLSLSFSTFLRFEVSWISRGENVEGIFEFKFINLLIFTSSEYI